MKNRIFIATLGLLILLHAPALHAEIYKYIDDNGRMVFVDNESKIPPQHRRDKTTISGPEPKQNKSQTIAGPSSLSSTPGQGDKQDEIENGPQVYEMGIRIHGNRVIVPVSVATSNNRIAKLMLLLDTGATRTVLHRDALKRLKVPKGQEVLARIAGGKTLPSERVLFHYIKIGPYRQDDMVAMVIDSQGAQMPFDGMLGMDFLRDHPYVIDFEEEIISWELVE
jgi:predicted aspartyl protease